VTTRIVALSVVAAVGLLAFSSTAATRDIARWRVVKSKSASGQFALTGTSAMLRRPKGAAVRFIGRNVQGSVVWACSKNFSIGSWSRDFRGGLHVLRFVRGKDTCNITASVTGEGRVTVQILKLV
jgi:hypothetical protein